MSLFDHARAARILSAKFEELGTKLVQSSRGDRDVAIVASIAFGMAGAYGDASDLMEAEAKAEIRAIGGACTLDYSLLRTGQKCPACQ